jgi:hypothetical protein
MDWLKLEKEGKHHLVDKMLRQAAFDHEWERQERPLTLPTARTDIPPADNISDRLAPALEITEPSGGIRINEEFAIDDDNESNLWDGWLSPRGKFFPVQNSQHYLFAAELLRGRDVEDKQSALMNSGWLKCSSGQWMRNWVPLTSAQVDFLHYWKSKAKGVLDPRTLAASLSFLEP